jgi:hypothetical protein
MIDTVRMLSVCRALSHRPVAREGVRVALRSRSALDSKAAAVRKDVRRKLLQQLTKVLGKYSRPFIKHSIADITERKVPAAEDLKCGMARGYRESGEDNVTTHRIVTVLAADRPC